MSILSGLREAWIQFSFFLIGYLAKAKDLILPYYIPC